MQGTNLDARRQFEHFFSFPFSAHRILSQLTHLRPEQRYIRKWSKGSNRLVKYFLENHPVEFVGIKWLLQNKNERCVVFKRKEEEQQ